jgi:hypothetical protein
VYKFIEKLVFAMLLRHLSRGFTPRMTRVSIVIVANPFVFSGL